MMRFYSDDCIKFSFYIVPQDYCVPIIFRVDSPQMIVSIQTFGISIALILGDEQQNDDEHSARLVRCL